MEYANIDFSLLKRTCPRDAVKKSAETEYAEIKKEIIEETEDDDDEKEGEEEETTMEEDEETEGWFNEEETEDMVYSNVQDLLRDGVKM